MTMKYLTPMCVAHLKKMETITICSDVIKRNSLPLLVEILFVSVLMENSIECSQYTQNQAAMWPRNFTFEYQSLVENIHSKGQLNNILN